MKATIKGLLAAIIFSGLAWLLPEPLRLPMLAGLLWLTVGMYLGMALMDGERHLLPQLLGGIPVLVLALMSWYTPMLLVLAWLIHPGWDLLHHFGVIRTKIHPVTVPFCMVFDVLIAGTTFAVVQDWI